MSFLTDRRVAYYFFVLVFGVLVHQGLIVTVLGNSGADLLRRNSEAYALMWVPLYWDLFALRLDPQGRAGSMAVGGRVSAIGQLAWFSVSVLIAIVLQTDIAGALRDSLPQAIVTLGEAFFAAAFIGAYLGWSRGLFAPNVQTRSGRPVVAAPIRLGYYVAVVAIAVIVEQSWMTSSIGDWLQLNTEAFAAMLLIPAYFDVIAPARRPAVRIAWYSLLVLVPITIQAGLLERLLPGSLVGWMETTTEALVAAFVVSVYFDVVRGWLMSGTHGSGSGEVADRFAEKAV